MPDPHDWFLETDETDGCGWTKVKFGSSGSSVSVVGSGRGCITDWDSTTFEPQIAWAYENGITGGCDLDMFCPGNPVTRRQMAMFIDRAIEPPLPPTDQDFFDDDDGMTGEGSINRMAAAGITGGCGERRYCPGRSVTREEMAAFLVRALQLPPPVEPDHFVDDDSSPFEANIDSLFEAGITTGCSTDHFCPPIQRHPRPDGRLSVSRLHRLAPEVQPMTSRPRRRSAVSTIVAAILALAAILPAAVPVAARDPQTAVLPTARPRRSSPPP